jgi:hypothetical protein
MFSRCSRWGATRRALAPASRGFKLPCGNGLTGLQGRSGCQTRQKDSALSVLAAPRRDGVIRISVEALSGRCAQHRLPVNQPRQPIDGGLHMGGAYLDAVDAGGGFHRPLRQVIDGPRESAAGLD